ncbi:hypothetical protein BCR44DRAFT_1434997 [Catenaria anguillulae PL171]|uniref:t-SNARE coiled-coil homology domain-containing protein n=1 Tax=Catenaria anguillulae PL171 TaxID=765915 RepID=A0A1Y2HKF2_9FUNG|nr:hypothetical protein BCR44DRAFT_1434997 [Catenaria anguillulae PL171]
MPNGNAILIPSTVFKDGATYYRLVVADLALATSDAGKGSGNGTLRRYSDIANVHDQLIKQFPLHAHLLADAGLPPKALLKNSTAVGSMLGFSSPDGAGSRLGLGPPSLPWLDRYHRVQAAIIDVRKAALDRDTRVAQGDTLRASQVGTQAVHDADTILREIDALDLALSSSAASSAASTLGAPAVSAKERVRRGNLLLSAKQEILAVQQRLNVSSYYDSGTGAGTSGARSPAFASLVGSTAASPARGGQQTPTTLSSSSPSHAQSHSTGGGRRVVGRAHSPGSAMLPGTLTPPTTYGNSGLLQLQRAQMADQDHAVEQIGAVVGRLKNLGHVMNEELEAQNQLLDETKEDVDRVAGRMRAAEKKIKKLN